MTVLHFNWTRTCVLVAGLGIGVGSVSGCSSEEGGAGQSYGGSSAGSAGKGGGAGGAGAAGGSGPAGGAGGAGAAGGAGGAGGNPATCNQATIDPTTFPECGFCPGGRCVPKTLVPSPEQLALLAECSPTDACVPDHFVATAGNFAQPKCVSLMNAEGRCMPLCVPKVAQRKCQLPTAGCEANHVCAPCFDPIDGADTGACGQGCDAPPAEPKVTFAPCCTNTGLCVPDTIVPPGQKARLPQDSCQAGQLCAPTEVVKNQGYQFPTCKTDTLIGGGAPGVCVPACIVDKDPNGSLVGPGMAPDNCKTPNTKCAPCTNPLDGMPTGACNPNVPTAC